MRSVLPIIILSLSNFILFTACQKELSLEKRLSSSTAKGSLKDASGNCLPNSVNATWYNGVTLGDSNFVAINVNITQIGSYKISTDFQNGVIFSDSGAFNSTGNNTFRLKPASSFIHPGQTLFTFSFNNTSCTFTVNVKDSTGTGLGAHTGTGTGTLPLNTWKFTANGHVFNGGVQSAQFVTLLGGTLLMAGTMQSGAMDTAFSLSVQFPSSTLATGIYPSSVPGTNFLLQKIPSGDVIFAANASNPPLLNISITGYNSSSKTVDGTFTGNSYDFSGHNVPISNGAFSAKLP